ncbi:lipopolysaccharide biosynthesis protein [Marinobacter sp. BSs20148]|uniref:lipopolysaccharide biosynthesis protein n=1 Tax=Marinobacter sp. BSs20148 TaxID=490759 RepID=UPI0002777130|nr:oligosaccharide flippase family protein [Marinobacter sp. BSs20148]AFP31448.1 hypothetical protein MRBBS_2512 [Marinobacter sp. BSs20148]
MGNIQSFLPNWCKGKFLRNVVTLVSGTAIAQAASLLFLPLITRLYGPEAFGGLGYFSSLLGFLTPLAAFCYPLALVLPKRRSEAKVIFDLSLKLALVMSFVTGVGLFLIELFFDRIVPFNGSYFFVPIGMFLSFCVMAYTQWAIKYGRFRLVALVTILTALGAGSAKVIFGYYYPSAVTLISISVFILIVNVVVFSVNLRAGVKLTDILAVKKRHLAVAKKYIRFPLYRTPHAMMAVVSQTAPIFLLTAFYGAKYAGFFALTRTVLGAPVTLIGKAVYDASYPKIAQRYNEGQANLQFVIKVTLGLAALSVFPLIIVFFAGGYIFEFLFGGEWKTSGIYAAWMAIWFAFNFLNKAAAAAVSVYGLDGFLFRNGLLNMVLSLVGFYLGALLFESDVASVAMFSLFGVVCQCFLIIKVVQVIRSSDKLKLSKLEASNS